jgi:peroxiredoxin family protein
VAATRGAAARPSSSWSRSLGALHQLELPAGNLVEYVALVGSPRRQVDRRLRVGRQDEQARTRGQLGYRPLGHRERQWASEATGVDGVHNAIVAQPPYALAAIVATGDPLRLYSALSAVVSTAAATQRCAVLLTFRGLELFRAPDLERRAADAGDPSADGDAPVLTPAGRTTFARGLVELRDTALALDAVEVYACAATTELGMADPDLPVISTPRFLRETAGAQLVFV